MNEKKKCEHVWVLTGDEGHLDYAAGEYTLPHRCEKCGLEGDLLYTEDDMVNIRYYGDDKEFYSCHYCENAKNCKFAYDLYNKWDTIDKAKHENCLAMK